MKDSLKKFLGNKNTVTIIGVILCMIILYIGYTVTINKKVALVRIPYANQTIQPKTEITSDMISYMEVAGAFVTNAKYLSSADEIVGKYSGYNTVIAAGSPFYSDLVIDKKDLPKLITKLEKDMHKAAKILDFERAAEIRDQLKKLREMAKE